MLNTDGNIDMTGTVAKAAESRVGHEACWSENSNMCTSCVGIAQLPSEAAHAVEFMQGGSPVMRAQLGAQPSAGRPLLGVWGRHTIPRPQLQVIQWHWLALCH